MKSRLFCVIGLLALSAWLILPSTGLAQTDDPSQNQNPTLTPDCAECHSSTIEVWEQSAHGKGLSCNQCHQAVQEEFVHTEHGINGDLENCAGCHTTGHDPDTNIWESNNIYCTVCHSPIEPNHPEELMPTNRSETLCGQCHIQSLFEWQTSKHGQAGISCVSCHRQHGTDLRRGNVMDQCADCHGTRVEAFSHSEHGDQGLSCDNCHLASTNGAAGETSKSDHSFAVALDTCLACHASQLHDETAVGPGHAPIAPAADHGATVTPPGLLGSVGPNTTADTSEQPDPISQAGVKVTTWMFSLTIVAAFGLILTSVLRRRVRLLRRVRQ